MSKESELNLFEIEIVFQRKDLQFQVVILCWSEVIDINVIYWEW
jgi:hypothetical protein